MKRGVLIERKINKNRDMFSDAFMDDIFFSLCFSVFSKFSIIST